MNFIKRIWAYLFGNNAACSAPSQHLRCPCCNTLHDNKTHYEKTVTTFEESENEDEWLYRCGHCCAVSRWNTTNPVPLMLSVESYGVTMETLRKEIQDHFRYWMPGRFTPDKVLSHVAQALTDVADSLSNRESWKGHKYADIGLLGNSVDLIIYALLVSGEHNICEDFNRQNMHATTTAIEMLLSMQEETYDDIVETVHAHAASLRASSLAAENVPYIFVQPNVNASAAALLRVGVLLVQMQHVDQIQTAVYERLHHFAFMSA